MASGIYDIRISLVVLRPIAVRIDKILRVFRPDVLTLRRE